VGEIEQSLNYSNAATTTMGFQQTAYFTMVNCSFYSSSSSSSSSSFFFYRMVHCLITLLKGHKTTPALFINTTSMSYMKLCLGHFLWSTTLCLLGGKLAHKNLWTVYLVGFIVHEQMVTLFCLMGRCLINEPN
jgi:hypothetical protein